MRRNQRFKSVIAAAALLALPVPFVLPELVGPVPAAPELVWLLAAIGIGLVLGRIFRTRSLCPELSDAEERWLRSLQPQRGRTRPRPPTKQPLISLH